MATRCTVCKTTNEHSASACSKCGTQLIGTTQITEAAGALDSAVGRPLGSFVVIALSLLYLLNPLAGVDIIPDYIPIVGNLDDAGVVYLLVSNLIKVGWLPVMERDGSGGGLGSSVLAICGVVYLLNPFFGVDLLPDLIPVVGNLDETGVAYFLMTVMAKRGWISVA